MCKLSTSVVLTLIVLGASVVEIQTTVIYNNGLNQATASGAEGARRRCPLCDSSVYSYCSDKLFHDSCCCYRPTNPYDRLPYECQYADCGFLHANTCKEHELISACCCTNLYLHKKK